MWQTQRAATIGNRVLAFALDYLVMVSYLIGLALIGFLASRLLPSSQTFLFSTALSAQATGFALVTLPISLYFVLLDARGSTLGKQRRDLKVIRLNGQPLGFRLSLKRTALKFLPWELSHTCVWQLRFEQWPSEVIVAGFVLVWVLVGGNVLSLLTNTRHQTLYDKLSGTMVIDV